MLPVGPSMIVQCDKCKTKFRIADNKINDTGVKVRCSRCAHVFVVRADAGAAIPHFSDRGPDTARVDAMSLASLAASTQPSAPDPPTWTGIPGARTEQSSIPGLFGGQPRAQAPSFPPAAQTSSEHLASLLGFAGAPPPAPPPLPPGGDFSEARTVQTHMKTPGSGPKAPPPKVKSDAHLPSFPGAAPKTPAPLPIPIIPKAVTDPDPSIRFPPPPDLLASLEAEEPGGAATEMALPGVGDDFIPPDNFSIDSFPPPPPSSDLAPFGEAALPPSSADDPFANVDIDGPKSSPNNYFAQTFDADANKPTAASEILARIDLQKGPPSADSSDPFANLEATAHGVDAQPPPKTKRPRARATTVPALPQLEHRTRRWPTVLGVTVGAAFALFVYPGLADGLILAIEGRSLAPLFESATQVAVLPDGLKDVRAVDPIITRYPIASKSGILVVSGRVENESSQALDGLEAVVLVMDGEQIKERQAAPVGVMLDPRALTKIVNADDLGAAWSAAKSASAPKPVGPGELQTFMVVFPQAGEDFEARTLRVEFVKATAGSIGAR